MAESVPFRLACVDRKKNVAARLLYLRKRRGFRQSDVAASIGISPQTLCGYEHGRNEPPLEAVARLAALYCVTVDLIVRGGVLYYEKKN